MTDDKTLRGAKSLPDASMHLRTRRLVAIQRCAELLTVSTLKLLWWRWLEPFPYETPL